MYAKITEDHLFDPNDNDPVITDRTGMVLFGNEATRLGSMYERYVRLLDDDRIPYYTVLATNDDEVLERVLEWGMRDSGATILQVRIYNAPDLWEDYMN